MKQLSIPNSKGQKLAAIVDYPESNTGKLAILCPGFLDTKDYDHLVELSKALAGIGYTVARFNPTGTWDSEGDIAEYTTSQYLQDIKSVLDYMTKEHEYTHILLGGHSRGGMVSILFAARNPRVSAVLGIMPSSGRSLMGARRENWQQTGFSTSQRDIPGTAEKKEFKVPYSHVVDRDQYDVAEEAKKVKVPILFIAGQADTLVPPPDVKVIFDAANEPKQFIVIPGIGHDYRYHSSEVKIVNETILKALQNGL